MSLSFRAGFRPFYFILSLIAILLLCAEARAQTSSTLTSGQSQAFPPSVVATLFSTLPVSTSGVAPSTGQSGPPGHIRAMPSKLVPYTDAMQQLTQLRANSPKAVDVDSLLKTLPARFPSSTSITTSGGSK